MLERISLTRFSGVTGYQHPNERGYKIEGDVAVWIDSGPVVQAGDTRKKCTIPSQCRPVKYVSMRISHIQKPGKKYSGNTNLLAWRKL